MKRLKIHISGRFHLDGNKYPFLTYNLVLASINAFIEEQFPSNSQRNTGNIQFKNSIFRFKVRRGKNYLRAFNSGQINLEASKNIYEISYQGTLHRGVVLASLHTVFIAVVFWYIAHTAMFLIPVFFIANYLIQIYLTHLVFPMALAKHLHQLLKDNDHENS